LLYALAVADAEKNRHPARGTGLFVRA